jgi:diaminopimelate epimerase
MKFTKMQGCGNDYVYINCFEEDIADRAALALRISDRHFGVGSDGLICIEPSETADFKMDMYNADGSQSPMCGNGIRCVGKYVYDHGMTDKTDITIETGSGIKKLHMEVRGGRVEAASVCMGAPIFTPSQIPVDSKEDSFIERPVTADGRTWFVTALSVGNPHAVTFVPDVDTMDLKTLGPLFEFHPLFPARINAEFVQVLDPHTLKMRVWERGSGETLACGTGASAALAAAAMTDRAENSARVLLPGGELRIEWNRQENLLYMTGPAVTVFEGIY